MINLNLPNLLNKIKHFCIEKSHKKKYHWFRKEKIVCFFCGTIRKFILLVNFSELKSQETSSISLDSKILFLEHVKNCRKKVVAKEFMNINGSN